MPEHRGLVGRPQVVLAVIPVFLLYEGEVLADLAHIAIFVQKHEGPLLVDDQQLEFELFSVVEEALDLGAGSQLVHGDLHSLMRPELLLLRGHH